MERRIALVTGGNRGIGYEVCRELAHLGCQVVLTSRNEKNGQHAMIKLGAGHKIVFRKLDVTNNDEVEGLRDWIVNTYGRLDILINNAGVYLDEGVSVFDIEEKTMRDTLEINFYGAFHLCRAFVPNMRQNGFGRIVNVSSGYGAMSEMGGRK